MALPPLATVNELASWIGVSLAPDDARATAVLSAVSALVRSEAGQTWEGLEVPADVHTVVLQAAERKWRNPSGATSRTAGPFTEGYAANTAVGLYLTADEKEILARYRTVSTGLWVQPTYRNDELEVHRYVDVAPDGEPVLYYASDEIP